MLKLTDKDIAVINMRLDRSLNGLASAKEHLTDQRQTYTGLTIDTADQIAMVEALCRTLPDPTQFRDKIDRLKKRLEEFEDLLFNSQDKAELITANAGRPNNTDKMAWEMNRKAA